MSVWACAPMLTHQLSHAQTVASLRRPRGQTCVDSPERGEGVWLSHAERAAVALACRGSWDASIARQCKHEVGLGGVVTPPSRGVGDSVPDPPEATL